MKPKSTKYLRCCRQAGLTLIEVVAAIAILGSILVGVVMAKVSHTRQLALSQRQMAAVQAADALISSWWLSADGVPIGADGTASDDGVLRWRTFLVQNDAVGELGARVVRVEDRWMHAPQSPGGAQESDEPLVDVDLVIADPDRQGANQ